MSAVVALKLTSPVTQAAAPFCFGQPFKRGDVPAGQYAHLDLANFSVVPMCYWNDGSLKHAALIGRVALTANVQKQVNVVLRGAAGSAGTPLTAASIASAAPTASVTFGATGTVSLASLLGAPLRTFISCKEMVSCQYAARPGADPSFLGGFHVCLFADGRMSVRVIAANSKFTVATARRDYIPTVTIGGATVFDNGGVAYKHSPDAEYDVTGWIGTDPQVTPQHDTGYLLDTPFFQNYDKVSSDAAIISYLASISAYVPGSRGGHNAAMGATGPQPQIGVLTQWDAHYFITRGSKAAWDAVIANARAIKSYAMSQRDPATFGPIKLADYPTSNVPGGGTYDFGSVAQDGSSLVFERAHAPTAGFLAYLLTCDPSYLETCQFNAKVHYLGETSASGSGVNRIFKGQVRSRAWGYRSIAQAASILPDNMLAEMGDVKTWAANIASAYLAYYLPGGVGSAYGFVDQYLNYLEQDGKSTADNGANCTGVAMWQQDFLAAAFGHASNLEPCDASGMASINGFRDYLYRGIKCRLGAPATTGDFNYGDAANYYHNIRKSTSVGTSGGPTAAQLIPSSAEQIWKDTIETAVSGALSNPATTTLNGTSGSTPNVPDGYWRNMISALSYAVDDGASWAVTAWGRITSAPNFSDLQGADTAYYANFGNVPLMAGQQAIQFTPVDTGAIVPTGGPSINMDNVPFLQNGIVMDTNRGCGILAGAIPTGFAQPHPLLNDVDGADPAGSEYAYEVTIPPAGLTTFVINQDGSVTATGPDGTHVGQQISKKNGVWTTEPFNIIFGTEESTVSGVTVSPSTATGSQTFTATVAGTGSPSQSVTWSRSGSAGSINSSGVFTAPAQTGSIQTITITATSVQDGTKSGTATVTIAAATPTVSSVTIAPSSVTVAELTVQTFTATVNGTFSPSQAVTWSANLGSITSGGVWTAPAATPFDQSATITATSVANNTKSGTATAIVPADTPAVIVAPRFARPVSDVAAGAWTPSTGSTLFGVLDETTASSADFISTTAPTTCEVALNAVTDPHTSSGQVVRYQAWAPSGGGVTVQLKQGATVIASWPHASLPTTPTVYTQSLTGPQCDAITDYANLRFAFVAAA